MTIVFTQFLRPHGRKKETHVENQPPEIEKLYSELKEADYRFEVEVLTTGLVFMTCDPPGNPDTAEGYNDGWDILSTNQLCKNGPEVVEATAQLIKDAHERYTKSISG